MKHFRMTAIRLFVLLLSCTLAACTGQGGSDVGNWIQLRLLGVHANRTAAGARITVRAVGAEVPPMIREVAAGSSYCSVGDPRLHIGIGTAESVDVEVRWPGGAVEVLDGLAAGQLYLVREGSGVIASRGPVTP